jgi:hypothetical protein
MHYLNLRREVERLHQEISSVNEIIKLLKEDMNLIQRYANVSTTQDNTNADWHNLNLSGNIRSNEWQTVKDNKKWRNNRGKSQQRSTIVNQFAVLSGTTSDCDRQKQLGGIKKKQIARNKIESRKNKIILMGDGHIKGYASELLNRLDRKFEVMGTVMPGARIQNIVKLCEQEVNSLTWDDILILWGDSNDVAKNETVNGLRHLRKFINKKKNTNFLLITVPHRYGLMDSSCVNEEIKVFNRKMHKIMKLESNVEILDIKLDRSCYTRHGLHLNITGKKKSGRNYDKPDTNIHN